MPKRSVRLSSCPVASNRTPEAARIGSHNSYLSPFLPHLAAAMRYAARKVRPDEVDDVIQDSLLRIMSHSGEAEIHHPKSYLMMVVRAVIVDRMRYETTRHRSDHHQLIDAYHPVDVLCPCRILTGRQELESAVDRLSAMPKRTREMLFAVRLEGASFKETAERYNVSISTVEKQVARALADLASDA